jgi:hypothetical protein
VNINAGTNSMPANCAMMLPFAGGTGTHEVHSEQRTRPAGGAAVKVNARGGVKGPLRYASVMRIIHRTHFMPPNQNRTRRMHLVTTPTEYAMAKALADRKGLTISDIVRLQIREAYEREIGVKDAPKMKRPR